MKIAVLSSHTPSLFWFRMDMMKDFQKRGHEVIAIGDQAAAEWSGKFKEHGIKYRQADIQRNGTNPIRDLKTLWALKGILAEERPDKVFAYQAKTVIYGAIAAGLVGITEVYPLIAGVGSVFLSNALKTHVIRMLLCAEYRYSIRKCPAVFFQNKDDVAVFRDNLVLKNQRIVMLHGSGVNLERFQQLPFPDKFGFLCIARLIRDKGIVEYLEACTEIKKMHPEVRCLLVGPFDTNPSAITKEELQPYIQNGIVEYFGEQSDVVPYLRQCSVFVLPSYREGTPKTVLEAMACGRAIITTDAPGCRETVKDSENGFLVPVKDVSAIVEKMELLLHDSELLVTMGNKGRQMAEELFDVRRVNQIVAETMQI